MKPPSRHDKNQGMNWIRPEKRLAIYLRDSLACCYCGESVEHDAKLTLDHPKPYERGGTNSATNLITCCHRCNSVRGSPPWRKFAGHVANYINHGVRPEAIIAHVRRTVRRALDVRAAKQFISERGGFSSALRG
jgi:hypothetical protein